MKSLHAILLAVLASVLTTPASAAETKVFAAASLTDVMQALAKDFESQSGNKIIFNFAGSNVLARQIVQGAPADLFLSADEEQMDVVAKAGLLVDGTRQDILSNTLVVIVPKESTLVVQGPGDLAKVNFKRLALADPKTVPAGVYAKAYLDKAGAWDTLKDKVIPTENVRAAVAAVSSGNAEVGIVYKTDTLASKEIRVIYEVPASDGPRILYPLAALRDTGDMKDTEKFLKYLESPTATKLFAQYGFSTATK